MTKKFNISIKLEINNLHKILYEADLCKLLNIIGNTSAGEGTSRQSGVFNNNRHFVGN